MRGLTLSRVLQRSFAAPCWIWRVSHSGGVCRRDQVIFTIQHRRWGSSSLLCCRPKRQSSSSPRFRSKFADLLRLSSRSDGPILVDGKERRLTPCTVLSSRYHQASGDCQCVSLEPEITAIHQVRQTTCEYLLAAVEGGEALRSARRGELLSG